MIAEKERGSFVGNRFPSLWGELDIGEYGDQKM